MPVVDPGDQAVGTGWDDGLHAAFLPDLHERVGIVALIGDHCVGREVPDQPFGLPDVGRLPTGEDEDQGVTQGIGHGMKLGAKAPRERPKAAASAALGFVPAAQGWARTTVLSINRCCWSGSHATWACSSAQTPRRCHRANRLKTSFQPPHAAGNNRH